MVSEPSTSRHPSAAKMAGLLRVDMITFIGGALFGIALAFFALVILAAYAIRHIDLSDDEEN